VTDKEYREQKKRIEALIRKWIQPLGLNWWELTYVWIRGTHDGSETVYAPFTGKNEQYACIMEVSTDYYYKTATIKFYLETIKEYEDIERYFVHELMHIFLKPMQSKGKADEEELIATHLANAFIWAREAGQKDKNGQKENGISVVAEGPSA
jgi:hypothetical protein